jgi:hypothetical protein
VRAAVALVEGRVKVVPSVPVKPTVLFTVKVLLLAIVSVDADAGAVIVTLLTVVKTPVEGVVAPTDPFRGPENPVDVKVVPLKVRLALPARVPLLLYWT